jgi:hypothetical protein
MYMSDLSQMSDVGMSSSYARKHVVSCWRYIRILSYIREDLTHTSDSGIIDPADYFELLGYVFFGVVRRRCRYRLSIGVHTHTPYLICLFSIPTYDKRIN